MLGNPCRTDISDIAGGIELGEALYARAQDNPAWDLIKMHLAQKYEDARRSHSFIPADIVSLIPYLRRAEPRFVVPDPVTDADIIYYE